MSRAALSLLALALVGLAPPVFAESSTDDVLMRALRDELERTTQQLRMEQAAPPYFVAYRIDEVETASTVASFGAIVESETTKNRTLVVEMRVGDANLDNTNFLSLRNWDTPTTRYQSLPLDNDYRELRRHIWLATDSIYKHALETLAKKRAALRNRRREEVPDFSAEEPRVWQVPQQPAKNLDIASMERMERTARDLSRLFANMPDIHDSRVDALSTNRRTRYLNSEGTSFDTQQTIAKVLALAQTQAPDGTILQDFEAFNARTWQQLPKPEAMADAVATMGSALATRREADFVERYSGPILLQGQAAAELFAQAMLPRLLAMRVPVLEGEGMNRFAASLRNPFEDKIGARVLPRFLNVYDDPTLQRNAVGELLGGYAVDGDGVPAAPTVLVENGILKTLLSSRNPINGVLRSSGNQRGEFLLPSNLLVTAQNGLDAAEMQKKFAAVVSERGNEYGIVVQRWANPELKLDWSDSAGAASGLPVDRPTRAYKVYADGREEPIRKLELSGFNESDFRHIVAVSRSATNYSLRPTVPNSYASRATSALYGGIAPHDGIVSISVPDLLFEELTVRKPVGDIPRPPVMTHPSFQTVDAR